MTALRKWQNWLRLNSETAEMRNGTSGDGSSGNGLKWGVNPLNNLSTETRVLIGKVYFMYKFFSIARNKS